MRACVRACVRMCVRVRARACVRVCVGARAHAVVMCEKYIIMFIYLMFYVYRSFSMAIPGISLQSESSLPSIQTARKRQIYP